jgi:hypothetical protein
MVSPVRFRVPGGAGLASACVFFFAHAIMPEESGEAFARVSSRSSIHVNRMP